MSPRQAELFEPAEYLDQEGGPGYFSVLTKPYGSPHQWSYELRYLATIIQTLNPAHDAWITQATFRLPNRRAVNLRTVGLLFADLDTYRRPGLSGKTPEEQLSLLLVFCEQEGMPPPSIVLYSGRGLQAKWLLDEALGPVSLFEWNEMELALVRLLEPFAADLAARDVSRVLRVDRTTNTKSGQRVRVIYVAGDPPARYSVEDLSAALRIGEPPPSSAGRRVILQKATIALPQSVVFRRLNWFRLYDLRALWKGRGGVPVGFRELTLFHELCFLLHAEPGRVVDLWKEAQALASQIDPRGNFYRRGDLSTVYRKAQETRHGQQVEYQGRMYPPLYTPKNQTLIDLFQITPEEEQGLRTIISQREKYRRNNERRAAERREGGAKTRPQYEGESISRAKPWEALGISRRTWYRRGKPPISLAWHK